MPSLDVISVVALPPHLAWFRRRVNRGGCSRRLIQAVTVAWAGTGPGAAEDGAGDDVTAAILSESFRCHGVRSRISGTGMLPVALPVIGGFGSELSPGSMTNLCSSEYHGPVTSGSGAGSLAVSCFS
jgi:hypothetical protein